MTLPNKSTTVSLSLSKAGHKMYRCAKKFQISFITAFLFIRSHYQIPQLAV